MSNRHVYIAGSLTNRQGYQEKNELFDLVVQLCVRHSLIPYAPHVDKRKRDIAEQTLDPVAIFRWDYERLKQADLVIAYVGIPSIGVGIELGLAAEWLTPVITFCEENAEISPMVLGHPTIKRHIEYRTKAELSKKLSDALAEV